MSRPPRPARAPVSARRLIFLAAILLVVAVAAGLACSLAGGLPAGGHGGSQASTIWKVRLFRLAAAATVGAALASGGLASQGLLRNPLAEPYLLGMSSGAGVGVLVGMAVSRTVDLPPWCTTPVLALLGALVTTAIVYGLAQRRGRLDPLVLLLSGVIINAFNGALVLLVLQIVERDNVIRFVGWGMGQVPESLWFRPTLLIVCGALVLAGWLVVVWRSSALNVLGLGDEVASSTGVAVGSLRLQVFLVVSLMTSASVALAGPIGFVGLIVPHMCRTAFGSDHRVLAVVCGLGGAIFLMIADTLCRLVGPWFAAGELPVGVVTALTGGPFFIWLLRRRLRGEEGS